MNATRRMLRNVDAGNPGGRKPWLPKRWMPFLVLLAMLPTIARSARAQNAPGPLNFGNNFMVTGDYVVAGAYNINQTFTTINGTSYTVGTINVPDVNPQGVANPGITGATSVPEGAQIVAALLYWQTVEKVGTPGTGQNGYFRPLLYQKSGGPAAPGYAISGTNVSGSNTVAWSSGGCGGSGGKVLKTYRADVAGGLPVDGSGNPVANSSFQILLPSIGNSTPLTLGATLVVIYRIPSGAGGTNIPLNAVVIYDGDYAQTNAQSTMTQQLQGFYDAATNPVSRLTQIVGSGQSNKFQTVYLGSGANSLVALPSLYGNQPAFPGWYGAWDNPTWTFNNAGGTNLGVLEDASSATTQVVPSISNQGCVSWGAIIVSTTVKNTGDDGILDSWKNNGGYCDASVNNGVCQTTDPSWVPIPDATIGQKDIYLQYDYMCSTVLGPPSLGALNSCKQPFNQQSASYSSTDHSFDPRLAVDATGVDAVTKVVEAFANHNVHLHVLPGNAIEENQSAATCTDTLANLSCPFANAPGTIGFREGLAYIKNQNIDPNTGLLCTPGSSGCGAMPVFQHGKKDSYHYALFSHGVGLPSWFLSDPTTLSSVVQNGNTVTFSTPSAHGIAPIPGDVCPYGRVTVVFAVTNPNLEGTYCVQATTPSSTTFAITVGGTAMNFTYTAKTDPNLAVANGQVTSMSGFSDVGGQNSVISLGYGDWGPPNNPASDGNTWQVKAGTFMHELGHTLGLTHGGTFYQNLDHNDYTPTFEANCKPNVQTSMSYLFQVDLLEKPNQFDQFGNPVMVVDYSGAALPTLTENLPRAAGFLTNTAYDKTAWYQLTSVAGGTAAQAHCDGTPLSAKDSPMSYVSDFVSNFGWSQNAGLDINFNGSFTDVMDGHDEWDGTTVNGVVSPGIDLQQISAVGTITTIGPGGESGALKPSGGGGALKPSGGGGALKPSGGGGALKPSGGGGMKTDITHDQANSYARPPRNLSIAQEEASARHIDLSWFSPTFGQIVEYNVYRSVAGGSFTLLAAVPGSQTTYQDTVNCNAGGYSYRITAVVNSDTGQVLESVPSSTVPVAPQQLLTGCYVITNFSSPATGKKGSLVPITWTLTDDFYTTPGSGWGNAAPGNPVTNLQASTLVAIGPLPNNCKTSGSTTILLNGVPTALAGASTFAKNNNQFTFTWATTCSGSYTFQLRLDSAQSKTTTVPLVLK